MAKGNRTSARIVRGREREVRALELRKAGASYSAIAARLGITPPGAYKAVMRALRRLNEKAAEVGEVVRRLELERLDRMLLGLWPHATSGQVAAVDRALRLMERRARLMGLDPQKGQEVNVELPQIVEVRYGAPGHEASSEEGGD